MYRDMRRRVHGRVVWPVRRVRCPWWVRVLLTTFGCNFSAITEQVLWSYLRRSKVRGGEVSWCSLSEIRHLWDLTQRKSQRSKRKHHQEGPDLKS